MIETPDVQNAPTIHRSTPPTQEQARRTQRLQERACAVLVLLAALLLEVVPVTVWLLFFAAASTSPDTPVLPFWWMLIVMLGAWVVAERLRRTSAEGKWSHAIVPVLRACVVVGWLLTLVVSLLLSPAAYLTVGLAGFPAAVAPDFETGDSRLGAIFGLALLVAYLWWRGLLLGRLPLTQHRLYSRFIAGLVAIVLAIASDAAVQGRAGHAIGETLAYLLPIDVFIGLVGLSLAHLLDALEEQRRRRLRGEAEGGPAPVVTRAWIVTALGISGGVVIVALLLALIVSYNSVQALAQALQPLGAAIMTVLSWLIEAFVFLLFLVLNPLISWLHDLAQSAHPQPQPTPNPGSKPPANPNTPNPQPIPSEWLIVGQWLLLALLIVVIVLVLVRVLQRFGVWNHPQEFEEERESLDARNLLGRQLRDLARRLFPRRSVASPLEALPAGSVRRLYRDMLQTAAQIGHTRQPSETPDEYVVRLQTELSNAPTPKIDSPDATEPEVAQALKTLTNAYDEARYRPTPDIALDEAAGQASTAVNAAQQEVLTWLRMHDDERDGT